MYIANSPFVLGVSNRRTCVMTIYQVRSIILYYKYRVSVLRTVYNMKLEMDGYSRTKKYSVSVKIYA